MTPKSVLESTKKQLKNVEAPVAGDVLNNVNRKNSKYGKYYGYYGDNWLWLIYIHIYYLE